MKGALIALVAGIAFLIVFYWKSNIYRSKTSFDIHIHDTYFVLEYASAIGFAFLFLGTFFSVGGAIGTQFKSTLFRILTLLFLSIDTYYVVSYYKASNSIKITIKNDKPEGNS